MGTVIYTFSNHNMNKNIQKQHDIHTQSYEKYMEMKKNNYVLETDKLRKKSTKNLGVQGVFF